MRNLVQVRKDIEKVDKKLRKYFLKRMDYSLEVKEIKKENNLPILDKDREDYLIRKYSKNVVKHKKEYIEFIEYILFLSKKGMED